MVERDHIAKLMSRLISEEASSSKKPFLYGSSLSMLSHMNYVHIHSDTFSVIEIFSLILYRFQQSYSKVFIVGQV